MRAKEERLEERLQELKNHVIPPLAPPRDTPDEGGEELSEDAFSNSLTDAMHALFEAVSSLRLEKVHPETPERQVDAARDVKHQIEHAIALLRKLRGEVSQ